MNVFNIYLKFHNIYLNIKRDVLVKKKREKIGFSHATSLN